MQPNRCEMGTRGLGTLAALALGIAVAATACGGSSSKRHAAESDNGSNAGQAPGGPSGTGPFSAGSGGSVGSSAPPSGTPGAGAGGSSAAAPGGNSSGSFAPLKAPTGNTNVALGGSQDFGFFRRLLADGKVPRLEDFDAAGFFAEHHTRLPDPTCGERVCLQNMLAVLGNLATGQGCTMLQLGLNSPLIADPNQRPPLRLAVSIDVSGSMLQGGKIDFVRAGLEKLIDGLRDTDSIALVTYSDSAQVIFPMAEVSMQRVRLRELARGLVATNGTNFHDGLEVAYRQVMTGYDSGRQNRVILLSDGQPTVGRTSAAEILGMSKRYNSDGSGLTVIGLGTDFNATLMRTLAQQADGNFYFLENSGAVSEVFTEELSFFTVPVAYDLKVEVEAGGQYTFGRAYGSPFWKSNANGGRLEVPSVFLAHRKSHADQTKDGGRRGGGSALLLELMPRQLRDDGSGTKAADVAAVRVTFREPGTNRLVERRVTASYPDAPWVTREKGFFDGPDPSISQKSFVMLNIYLAFEEAVRDFHGRSTVETIGRLRRLAAAVEAYNRRAQDKDIEADLALINQLIGVLRRNGVQDPAEIRIPTNPWPAD